MNASVKRRRGVLAGVAGASLVAGAVVGASHKSELRYKTAIASTFATYGEPLACGGTLAPGQLGVANKDLPCGTEVTFRVKDRELTVPVIDRGPFVAGRDFDLTQETAD